jgi:hypothetical protein
MKLLRARELSAAVGEEVARMVPPAPAFEAAADSVHDLAMKAIRARELTAEINEEIARIIPPAPLFEEAAKSIHDLAMEMIRVKEATVEINEEVERITRPGVVYEDAPEVFGITAAAEKRREAEELRGQVNEEYERLYGKPDQPGAEKIYGIPTKAIAQAQNMFGPGEVLPADAEGGGLTDLAAEAAPIAAIAYLARKVQDAVVDGMKSAIGGAGGLVAGIASADTDPARPIAELGEAASRAGGKIAQLEPWTGMAIIAIGETAKAFSRVTQAVDQTATRYGEYNQDIAREQALADIRLVRGDMRRSQELGPDLAKYVAAQSELKDSFEDLKAKLLSGLLPLITTSVNSLTIAVDLLNELTDLGKISAEALTLQLPTAITDMQDFLKRMANKPTLVDPTDMLFRQAPILPSGPGIGP